MTDHNVLFNEKDIFQALTLMARTIMRKFPEEPVLVGIRRGGVTLSERLMDIIKKEMGQAPAFGIIDINLYRDDWTRARSLPKVGRTEIPFNLDNRRVVLVDDVLYTGRTVRSALEALTEFGRASRIELAVLVDRGQREMPIQADYLGFKKEVGEGQSVEVRFKSDSGPDEVVIL